MLSNTARLRTRVVVVDDEPLIRWSLTQRLEKAGYQVVTADNAVGGLYFLHKFPPAVLITDIKLSPVSGVVLIREAREEFPSLPVIVLTAFRTQQLESELRDLGVEFIVDKPADINELLATVRSLIPDHHDSSSR